MKSLTRRDFVKSSVAAGAVAALPLSKVRGANGDIRAAAVGIRGRGGGLAREFHDLDGVRVVALCDVDGSALDKRVKEFADRDQKVQAYRDFRRMLEDKSIDVVAIATPDHWHVVAAALSIVAGKDVYVEKPLSHTIAEGRFLVNLARKHNKIVQHGTQARSSESIAEGIEYLRSGKLGKVRMAKAINCQL
ncbi:MAG: Gfo/Idh/MocA family protein, partial [Planctomycetota bacterium]